MMENVIHRSIGFHYPKDFSLVSIQGIGLLWQDKKQSFFYFNTSRKKRALLIYCLQGKVLIRRNTDEYEMKEQDALFLTTEDLVSLESPKSCKFLYAEFSKEAYEFVEQLLDSRGLFFSSCAFLLQPFMELYQKALHHEMSTIFSNSKLSHAFLLEVISMLLVRAQQSGDKVLAARSYIEEYFRDPAINLDQIAEKTQISKYYLCKEFKQRYDRSPGQYLKDLRLQEAARLLKEKSRLSIEQIAAKTGYSSSSYFGKVFKKYFGMTPDEYRRSVAHFDIVENLIRLDRKEME